MDALIAGGVCSVELTLTTPGTLEVLSQLVGRYADAVDVGVGTVVDATQLQKAMDAGVRYVVTPNTDPTLVETAVAAQMPIIPGGLTPTELYSSWRSGASAVKVFPASQVDAGYANDLHGPFPDLAVIPSGGEGLELAARWLRVGAVAVSVGGPLVGDAFRGGSMSALRERAARFAQLCGEQG